jgi:hypothetical protein
MDDLQIRLSQTFDVNCCGEAATETSESVHCDGRNIGPQAPLPPTSSYPKVRSKQITNTTAGAGNRSSSLCIDHHPPLRPNLDSHLSAVTSVGFCVFDHRTKHSIHPPHMAVFNTKVPSPNPVLVVSLCVEFAGSGVCIS